MLTARKSDVFVDVCTQRDYLMPDGMRPIANGDRVLPNLKRLMAFARWGRIPTLSCVDARRPDEARGTRSVECVLGTDGQRKVPFTLLPNRVAIDSDNCLCVALDLLQQHQQAILAKHHRDPFTNPKLDRLLTEMPSRRFVIFGVSLESSIRLLTLGLMLRHRRVLVVEDACGWWDAEEGGMTLRQLAAKGCAMTTTHDLIQSAVARTKRSRTYSRRSVA